MKRTEETRRPWACDLLLQLPTQMRNGVRKKTLSSLPEVFMSRIGYRAVVSRNWSMLWIMDPN
jgi:hypothetical protein